MSSHINSTKKKVFVGMSGGVDSSVTALLLKQEGYDVTGVFLRGWYPEWLPCNWREERQDAMQVAAQLGIAFETFDVSREYKRDVADYMIAEYTRGRTPNPDVMCNRAVKFGVFWEEARKRGADMIATGHYARNVQDTNNKHQLLVGTDTNKDQSYFLWTLAQDDLEHTLFPVGKYEKQEVRAIAQKAELPTAQKKDSQGICFLGDVDMHEFLAHYIALEEGNVLDESGVVVGTHSGAQAYTLGQRHGFTVIKKGANDGAYYVVAKDIEHNTITVSTDKNSEADAVREVLLGNANWISGDAPDTSRGYWCRFRYRQKLQSCRIEVFAQTDAEQTQNHADKIQINFDSPQHAVAPGQSLVLYDSPLSGFSDRRGGEVCLGGGIIENAALSHQL